MTFKRDVEQAIGFFKYDTDTWRDVFKRAGKEGGVDNKRIVNVLICILEELDAKEIKQEINIKEPEIDLGTTGTPIQQGANSTTAEVPTTTSDTKERQNSSK